MHQVWFYSLISVIIISLISLIGIITLSIKISKLRKFLIYLISFAAGTLFGDAFIHLLPETVESYGFGLNISLYILLGIVLFFILEKVIHWHHCHGEVLEKNHIHPFAYMNLVGDAFHNFLDGIIIAASYMISLPAGIATTLAVALHEIPQEIGDFGVLIHGGFSKAKALAVNFLSALFAILGAVLTLWIGNSIEGIELILVPIAIGGFLYIAGSDLIPQLHKYSEKLSKSILQIIAFILGIAVMAALLLLE
ncbi:MAG: ZIP family metal transporter [Nanoarchaeota archaeon]|nr:ZIP family metal transporter [Nanoarchaeota archaeon]MBU1051874.1 ZIP family metal transporter [Nanoarchaeota archaeon]MBU1988990.1 ZIP family metal transporter [Nanoarchaeota archaeon]